MCVCVLPAWQVKGLEKCHLAWRKKLNSRNPIRLQGKKLAAAFGKRSRVDGKMDAAKPMEGGRKDAGGGTQNAVIGKVKKIEQKSLSASGESRPGVEPGNDIDVAEVDHAAEMGGGGWGGEEDRDGYDDGGDSICAFCDDGGNIIW